MKTFCKYLTAACLAAAAMGCVSEHTGFLPGVNENGEEIGYLSFSETSGLKVEERNEQIDHKPGAESRAANVDVDTYTVEIVNAKGETVQEFLYGQRPEKPIELATGAYTLKVRSGETADAAWEETDGTPTYGAEHPFVIEKGKTTALGEIQCRLLSVKVTVSYRKSLYDLLSADTEADLTLGEEHTLTFVKDEKRAGYLRPPHTGAKPNSLVLYLTTVYEGKQITRQPLPIADNARAGEWRKIEVYLENAESGSLIINAAIETWVNGESVDVDVRTLAVLSEPSIPDIDDPNAPRLEWTVTHTPVDEPLTLTDDSFDENGYYTGNANLTALTTDVPMSHFTISLSSDNRAFMSYAEAGGVTGTIDLFTVEGAARTTLRSWGFPVVGLSSTTRTFPLNDLMKIIYDYEGTHTFTMAITDEANRRSTFELVIIVDKSGGSPIRIVWVGNNIDERQEVVKDLEVEIRIAAEKGIASLMVEIEGALGAGLGDVGLPPRFDLVDPDKYGEGLSEKLGPHNEETGMGFGFPIGDDVRGKNELLFPITSFMPLMGTFKGDTDFKMTVTDSEGNTLTKSVMLHVN